MAHEPDLTVRGEKLEPQWATREQEERAHQFGMWVFLATEVLFFGGLFIAYAFYRWSYSEEFHSTAAHMNYLLGTANTYVLLTSSLFVVLAVQFIKRGQSMISAGCLVVAIGLGVTFMAFKFIEYGEHAREGLLPGVWFSSHELHGLGSLNFMTLYWIMTGLHALHVSIGLCVLAWTAFQAASGFYTPQKHTGLELAGMYWHFVDVVWVFLYPLLYLV